MRFKIYPILLLIAISAVTSCKKGNSPSPIPPKTDTIPSAVWSANTDVYFVGTSAAPYPNNAEVATIWKNGVPTVLQNTLTGLSCKAYAVAVNGTDVYAVGDAQVSNYDVACYWKNGVTTRLLGGISAYAIAINGNDMYVGGYSTDINGLQTASYWKNGIATVMPDENAYSDSQANAIAVVGNDVYLAGVIYDPYQRYPVACFWKNGVLTKLSTSTSASIANGIAVIGGDVYVVGLDNMNTATVWKNGVATILEGGASRSVANAITTDGTDVYVSGFANGLPVYWKNGIKTVLPGQGNGSDRMGIAVNSTDVYVAGGFGSEKAAESIFWKNGLATKYDSGNPNFNVIYGVTVAQH